MNRLDRSEAERKPMAATADAPEQNSGSHAASPRAVAGEARLSLVVDAPPTRGGEPLAHHDIGRTVLSHAADLPGPLRAEENDSYPTVAVLNDRWRVIVCKHSIQWILQKRGAGPNHWRGRYFCRTREALIRCAREHAGETGGDALVILLRLPERRS